MSENNDPQSTDSAQDLGVDPDELREHAIAEARRIREDVPGNTSLLRTQRAILDRERQLTSFATERHHTEQSIHEAKSDVKDTRETLARLRDLGGDPTVFERLPDGTLVSVPVEGREAFENRLEDRLVAAKSRLESQKERLDAVKRGAAINREAIDWLEDELDRLAEGSAEGED